MKDENEAKNGSRCRLAPSATVCPRLPLFAPIPTICILHPSLASFPGLSSAFQGKEGGGVNAEFRRAVEQKPSARMPLLNGRRPIVGERPGHGAQPRIRKSSFFQSLSTSDRRLGLRRPRLPGLHRSLEVLAGVAGNAQSLGSLIVFQDDPWLNVGLGRLGSQRRVDNFLGLDNRRGRLFRSCLGRSGLVCSAKRCSGDSEKRQDVDQ